MKMLNIKATEIFCQLVDRLNGKDMLVLTTSEFMPLVMECTGVNISAPAGDARLYSLAHYYEDYGTRIFDPLMCFIAVDMRHVLNRPELMAVIPCSFRQHKQPCNESIVIRNGVITNVDTAMQKDQTVFAAIWLDNISKQGFLK